MSRLSSKRILEITCCFHHFNQHVKEQFTMLKSEKASEMEKPKFFAKSTMIYELPVDFTFDPIRSILKIQDEYQTFE